jgi:hypothetical protein
VNIAKFGSKAGIYLSGKRDEGRGERERGKRQQKRELREEKETEIQRQSNRETKRADNKNPELRRVAQLVFNIKCPTMFGKLL